MVFIQILKQIISRNNDRNKCSTELATLIMTSVFARNRI